MSVDALGKYVINSVKDTGETNMKHSEMVKDTIHYMSPASGRSVAMLECVESRSALEEPWPTQSRDRTDLMYAGEGGEAAPVTRSLLLIKPFAVQYEPVVIRKVQQHGLRIIQKRRVRLSAEQVSDFYSDPCDELNFPYSVLSCSSGPLVAICVAGVDAVPRLRRLVGRGTIHYSWFWPWAIRRRFGYVDSVEEALHASADPDAARLEIRFFFPTMILEPLLHTEIQVEDYLCATLKSILLEGLTELCKKKPVEPIIYLAEWLMLHNPYYPKVPPQIAKLPNLY